MAADPPWEEVRGLVREKRRKNKENKEVRLLGEDTMDVAANLADLMDREYETGRPCMGEFYYVEEGDICSLRLKELIKVGNLDYGAPEEANTSKVWERKLAKLQSKITKLKDDLENDEDLEFRLPQGTTVTKGEYATALSTAKTMWKASKATRDIVSIVGQADRAVSLDMILEAVYLSQVEQFRIISKYTMQVTYAHMTGPTQLPKSFINETAKANMLVEEKKKIVCEEIARSTLEASTRSAEATSRSTQEALRALAAQLRVG
jgi:hypothetical protein